MSEAEFVNGLFVKAPRDGAPDFVKGSISIKRADLGNWLRGKDDEWINLDIKESKNGKWYAEVNNWKPNRDDIEKTRNNTPAQASQSFQDDEMEDSIPF